MLLMLRQNTGYYDGWYTLPSGHVEELPIDGLLRETREEVGLNLARSSVRHIHTMYRIRHDETGERADYFFEVTHWEGEPTNVELDKCVSIGWFSLKNLPVNLMHHVRDALSAIERHESYSEIGPDKLVRNPSLTSFST